MMKAPELYRATKQSRPHLNPMFLTTKEHGPNGVFIIDEAIRTFYRIASNGAGWEHISVHGVHVLTGDEFTPTWEDMCKIKAIFWEEEDCVVQYHPRKSQYVNCHPHTLHLWRPTGVQIPEPESILVGPKGKRS
jgi:hypothetical protein